MQVISDEEIRVLAQNNPRLLTVTAVDTSSISDTGILALSQHCPDLDKLDVTRREMTYKITDVGMLALGQRSKSLRILKLNGCEVSKPKYHNNDNTSFYQNKFLRYIIQIIFFI